MPTEIINNDNLVTVREAAEVLGVSINTVSRYCRRGKLKAFKVKSVWAIEKAGLEEFDCKSKHNNTSFEPPEEEVQEMWDTLYDLIQTSQKKRNRTKVDYKGSEVC